MRGVLCAVLIGACVSLPSTPAEAAAPTATDPYVQAATSGDKVEVVDDRTEMSTTYANPDGTTSTDISPTPVRVRDGAGWEPVDLDLEFTEDGTVAPKAAPGEVELSAGGSTTPLISTQFAEVTASVTWPGSLPRPTIDGSTATYSDVLDDVDLKVSMTDAGPVHVLVVKNREAAQQDALKALKLPYEIENGEMVAAESGSLAIKDEAGQQVGVLPEATMWDSSGTAVDEFGGAVEDDSAEAVEQRTEGPVEGDDVDTVDTSLSGDHLVLEPPTDALTDADTTYPVYVDPIVSPSRYFWAMVFKENPNSKFHKWTDSNGQGVGYQNHSGVSTKRLLWRYKLPASMAHAHVYKATFSADLIYSWSCTPSTVRLYRVEGGIDSGTTWNHQPSWAYHLDDRKVAAARSGCDPGGKQIDFDATQGAKDNAARGVGYLTLGLRALRETDPVSWKRFSYKAILKVTYSRPPSRPTGLRTIVEGGAGRSCSSTKTLALQSAPSLQASTSDPDSGDQVRIVYELWSGTPGNSTKLSGPWGTWKNAFRSPRTPYRADSLEYYPKVDGQPREGSYFWTATAQDNSGSGHTTGLKSPASGYCRFTIDRHRPFEPIVQVPDDVDWSSSEPITVTVKPGPDPNDPDKAADVSRYEWGINTTTPDTEKIAAADGSATFEIPASMRSRSGLNRLAVQAYDAANNKSDVNEDVEFEIRRFDASSWNQWTFDEAGTVPAQPTGQGSALAIPSPFQRVLRGVYAGEDGQERSDRKLAVSGDATTQITTTVDPSESFTLSAWLDPIDGSATRTAVSLERGGVAVARIRVKKDCVFDGGDGPEESDSCYEFSVLDGETNSWVSAYTREEIASDEPGLQHVVGTYEASTGTLTIRTVGYDSGDADEDLQVGESTATVQGSGPATVRVSGSVTGSTTNERWSGFLDHVDVARGAADALNIMSLHRQFVARGIAEGASEGDG